MATGTIGSVSFSARHHELTCLNVLLVEGDVRHAFLLQHTLPCDGFHFRCVGELAEAHVRLDAEHYDLVLLDMDLSHGRHEEAIRHMLAHASGAPIVGLTARADEDQAFDALRAGVQECIVKEETNAKVIGRTMRNAVERSRLLAEVERARRGQVDAKQHLLEIVSHELRGPLHVARLSLGAVMDVEGLSAECQQDLARVDANLGRVADMVQNLLETARIEHGIVAVHPRPMDAGALVRETVAAYQVLARERSAHLATTVEADLPVGLGEPARLRQVLTNLIDNALRLTRSDTTVMVGVRRSPRSRDTVEVSVSDHGPGVDAENAERLFEVFHQEPSHRGQGGLGLGLFICREIVARCGGTIWAENVAGAGARFAFTIPCAPRGAEHAAVRSPRSRARTGAGSGRPSTARAGERPR